MSTGARRALEIARKHRAAQGERTQRLRQPGNAQASDPSQEQYCYRSGRTVQERTVHRRLNRCFGARFPRFVKMSWRCSLGRNFWHRSGYFGTVLCLVGSLYSLPNTPLLLDDGQLDWESSSFLAVCAFAAAVSFLLLQGSDPGYLDARTLPEAEQSQSLLRREGEDDADEEGTVSTCFTSRFSCV
eukprot:scaffold7673_cov258-Pinguiococcus_pyrenoidosus.AAC.15